MGWGRPRLGCSKGSQLAFELFWMLWKLPAFQQHLAHPPTQSLAAPVRVNGHICITGRGPYAQLRYTLDIFTAVDPILVSVEQLSWFALRYYHIIPSSGDSHLPAEDVEALCLQLTSCDGHTGAPGTVPFPLVNLDHWVQWDRDQTISRSRSRWPKVYLLGATVSWGNMGLVSGCSATRGTGCFSGSKAGLPIVLLSEFGKMNFPFFTWSTHPRFIKKNNCFLWGQKQELGLASGVRRGVLVLLGGGVGPVRSRRGADESKSSLVPILVWSFAFSLHLVRPQFSHQFPSSECNKPGL